MLLLFNKLSSCSAVGVVADEESCGSYLSNDSAICGVAAVALYIFILLLNYRYYLRKDIKSFPF